MLRNMKMWMNFEKNIFWGFGFYAWISFLKIYVINSLDNLPFQPYYINLHTMSFQKMHIIFVVQFFTKKTSPTGLWTAVRTNISCIGFLNTNHYSKYFKINGIIVILVQHLSILDFRVAKDIRVIPNVQFLSSFHDKMLSY